MNISSIRSRWAAVGAAVAVSLGAGGIGISHATISSGERPVYVPIEPCRLVDNRPAGIGEDTSVVYSGWGAVGDCNLPTTSTGLALNVTAVGATQQTNLRFYPADAGVPDTANLNPAPGAPPTPNAVNVDLDSSGEFGVYNRFGTVATVIDVMGFYEDHNHDDRYLAKAQDSEAAVDGEDTTNAVGAGDEILATVTVDTPTSGYVIVNSSVTLHGNGALSAARCSITTGTVIDTVALQQAYAETNRRQMISGTRGFTINKAFLFTPDEMTYNLVCDGIGGAPVLEDPQLNAIFIPDPDAFGLIIVPLDE